MYNSYFINRVRDFADGSTEPVDHLDYVEGDYYTVYGRLENGEVRALADCPDLKAATDEMLRIGLENEAGGTI